MSVRGIKKKQIREVLDKYINPDTGKLKKDIDNDLREFLKKAEVQQLVYDKDGKVKIELGGKNQKPVYVSFINSVNQPTPQAPAPAPAPEQKPTVKTTRVKATKPIKSPPAQKEEEEEKEEQKEDKPTIKIKPKKQPAQEPAEPKTVKIKKPSASTSQPPSSQDEVQTPTEEPPTLSPDERDEVQRKMFKQEFDEILKRYPEFAQSVSPPLQLQSEDQLKPKEKPKEQFKQTQVENVPRFQVPDIPSNIITTDFKTAKQLNDDIKYFFSNFGSALKDEQARYKKISKTNKKLVTELHKRITAKLGAKSTQAKNIGVVIDGKDYIKQAVNEILLTQSASKLKPEDLIINITDEGQQRDKDLKDIGTYETKGGRSIQKEPIYQFIPTDNSNVYKENKKPVRITKLAMPKTRAENYKEEYRNDAFATKPKNKPVRLKYLY